MQELNNTLKATSSADGDRLLTDLLRQSAAGNTAAKSELLRSVYLDMLRIARRLMRAERRDHTLQPTALVHEVMAKFLQGSSIEAVSGRKALFSLASQAMRHVLVDHARRRLAKKRSGIIDCQRNTSETILSEFECATQIDLISLDDALARLKDFDRRQHEIVVLHFFGGLRFPEIAEHLGISLSTVERDWRFARCWLLHRMRGGHEE